jgi:propionyl-CoA carboxylase alpha chain
MGITTVAVYSEPDEFSPHVDLADESYLIGPAPALKSYLNIPVIIERALACGADSIHPGYGFLSEKAEFAKAAADNGLIFIGPSPDVIRLMGDKLEAKRLSKAAGIPMVPGTDQPVSDSESILELAQKIGYPLLLKAAAGGGGKGMRVVHSDADVMDAFTRATSEARSSFGDDRVFVEKYIESPRHIEVQILADTHGNVIHLGERDCTLQRRHQKVIEESPSPSLSQKARQQMTMDAVTLAKQVGYTSAGTVEFIVDTNQNYYFLEMNTRLQVEHPVTEMVNNIDLVEEMIRIASGESLRYTQSDIKPQGHSIEARLYAEDPERNFLPSSGKLLFYRPPTTFTTPESALRVDEGVEEGSHISIYYDPMLAKLISFAQTRDKAISLLKTALSQFEINGIENNLTFLYKLLDHPNFQKAEISTHFIEDQIDAKSLDTSSLSKLSNEQQKIFLAVAAKLLQQVPSTFIPATDYVIICQETAHILSELDLPDLHVTWSPRSSCFSVFSEAFKEVFFGQIVNPYTDPLLTLFGTTAPIKLLPRRVWELSKLLHKKQHQSELQVLKSPMPGLLISLPIQVGQTVKAGETLAVIEAMKMENIIKAPSAATVKEICVSNGDSLTRGQVIAKFG